ncbi:MAG: hypothetical protein U9R79_03960 [Armatimonadota bacterium]|nr:hypothetical protein [Armatimonadota bacterium]
MRQGRGRGGASTLSIDLMEKLVAWSVTGLKISILAFLVSLAYILYGIFGGHLSGQVEARILGNLQLMGQVMAAAAGLGTVCLVIVTHEEIAVAVTAGIVGLVLMFGFPLLVAGQVRGGAQRAGDIITYWTSSAGEFMLIVVGLRVAWEIVNWVREAPARRAAIAREQGFEEEPKKSYYTPWWRLSHCWEMPYCHGAIRETCPAYTSRTDCWRLGQGCNCDPYLIESLLRKGAGTDLLAEQTSEYTRSDLTGDRVAGRERTRECRNCPIFNEHQRQKFRLLNPLIIVAAIVGLGFAYPVVRRLYAGFISFTAALAERFAFGTQVPVERWIHRLDSPAVWVFFYVILGLLAMSYVLKAVEWAVLRRKII